jgi:hypothetical protein
VKNNPSTNGGFTFTEYEWKRNEVVVSTVQYYTAEVFDGTYKVKLITDKGKVINVCEKTIFSSAATASLRAHPNPVSKGSRIALSTTNIPVGTEILIYDIQGRLTATTSVTGNQTDILLPQITGTYLILVNGETIKIVVE